VIAPRKYKPLRPAPPLAANALKVCRSIQYHAEGDGKDVATFP